MTGKEFIVQRICIFAGRAVDPSSDAQVVELLRDKFNIQLPQRSSFIESLKSAAGSHEILDLIIRYRALSEKG
jgi:DNA polymerase I-like protein with 3'-5' exonuclease and polymerase domains